MAEQAEKTEATEEQANGGGEGNGGGHKAVRAAAIAAATGATALAAKKAFSGKSQSEGDDEEKQKAKRSEKRSGGDDSMFSEMLTSGWDAAKDSLLPFAEDAAGAAGEWVARNPPELVPDTLVPRFIRGFERARKSGGGDDAADEKS